MTELEKLKAAYYNAGDAYDAARDAYYAALFQAQPTLTAPPTTPAIMPPATPTTPRATPIMPPATPTTTLTAPPTTPPSQRKKRSKTHD